MNMRIAIALLAVYLVWGSTYLAIRFAVETLPPFLLGGLRFVVSGLILLLWQRLAGQRWPTLRQWRCTAIVGCLLLLGGNGLVCWAEQRIPSGIAALIVGSVPMFMVIADALRPNGQRPTLPVLFGLLLGFAGIYLLIGPSALADSAPPDTWGVAAVLMASLLWAIGSVYSRNADLPPSALMVTGAEMFSGGLALLATSLANNEWATFDAMQVSEHSWLALAYLIVFGSMIGFASYSWLLKHASIPLVSTYAYVNPVVAVVLGNWLAQEALTPRILVSAAIIVLAIVIMQSPARRKTPAFLD